MHRPRAALALAASLAASLAAASSSLAGCARTPCEARAAWRNPQSSACRSCQSSACAGEETALATLEQACATEFACAARCAAGSATTCGCVEACLATPRCRAAFDAYVACSVQRCDCECQRGARCGDATP